MEANSFKTKGLMKPYINHWQMQQLRQSRYNPKLLFCGVLISHQIQSKSAEHIKDDYNYVQERAAA